MKQYCINCGNPTEYSLIKPKFCNQCGRNFNLETKSNKKIDIETVSKYDEDFDDLENEQVRIPILNSLEIEEIFIPIEKGETLGSILNDQNNKNSVNTNTKRKKNKKMSKKENKKILEEVLRESKSLRTKK